MNLRSRDPYLARGKDPHSIPASGAELAFLPRRRVHTPSIRIEYAHPTRARTWAFISPRQEITSLSPRHRLLLDIALFVALIVASNPAWTGLSVHEWLAGLLIIPALYHLIINWDWVARTFDKLFEKAKATSTINFVVDIVLFFATVGVMLSGFMVLPGVISTEESTIVLDVWVGVHSAASDLMVFAMVVHLLLHLGWMRDAVRKTVTVRSGRHAVGNARTSYAQNRGRR